MPKHATARIGDVELKMKDLAPPEEMERRREYAARLRARMVVPASESEKKIWREMMAELEGERLTFRS
jgi:hypothetical protein